jgi:hypothetical protein
MIRPGAITSRASGCPIDHAPAGLAQRGVDQLGAGLGFVHAARVPARWQSVPGESPVE